MDHKILRHPSLYGLGRPGKRTQDTKLENHPGFGCYAKLLCKSPKAGLMDKLHHYYHLAFSAMKYTAIPARAFAFGLLAYSWSLFAQLKRGLLDGVILSGNLSTRGVMFRLSFTTEY